MTIFGYFLFLWRKEENVVCKNQFNANSIQSRYKFFHRTQCSKFTIYIRTVSSCFLLPVGVASAFGVLHHNIADSSAREVPYKYAIGRRLLTLVGNRVSNNQHNLLNMQEPTTSRGCLYSCYWLLHIRILCKCITHFIEPNRLAKEESILNLPKLKSSLGLKIRQFLI